jgi:thiamine biosynthesis lipoprotein
MNKKLLIGILGAVVAGVLLWHRSQAVINPAWEQTTMGTDCHITLASKMSKRELMALRTKIDSALDDVNRRMSTWQPDTEISMFNAFESSDPFPISPDFAEVVQSALAYSKLTDGAFDPTVKPLVDYWGFGPDKDLQPVKEIMESVGWQKVQLKNGALVKDHPKLQLDLSGIAKGYGVDRVAKVIAESGYKNFIVEIGGEVVASGTNRSGKPWRVGIESPQSSGKAFGDTIYRALNVSDRAMASSGDYRHFQVRADGSRYSHIIDPHTGQPAESDVAEVTVVTAHCMDADAIATSLCVMGSEKGFQWLEKHPEEFQAFFILHAPDGSFISKSTPAFPKAD